MILVVAEQRSGKLNRATWETIAAAQEMCRVGSLDPAIAIAVAYDFEVVPEVPATEHDHRVDMVVTDARSWQFAR